MINLVDFNPRVPQFFEASRQVILEQHDAVKITDREITYSIESDGELFLLSRQERAEKPRQIMRATSLDDIERYPSKVPHGWVIEQSKVAPAFGRPGGAYQTRILDEDGEPVSIKRLTDLGVLKVDKSE